MNHYCAPAISEIGRAHELILGSKPLCFFYVDSEGSIYFHEPFLDIDETDE